MGGLRSFDDGRVEFLGFEVSFADNFAGRTLRGLVALDVGILLAIDDSAGIVTSKFTRDGRLRGAFSGEDLRGRRLEDAEFGLLTAVGGLFTQPGIALGAIRAPKCFAAGTLVMTDRGLRPIEQIEVGDLVLSRDEETGETAYKPVKRLMRNAESAIWELTVKIEGSPISTTEVLSTTEEHPWRTTNNQWTETAALGPGTQIVGADGRRVTVISVGKTDRKAPTFNFEVEDFHTYFVGAYGLWVHNNCFRVLQTGGQTLNQATADALNAFAGTNLPRREVGRALEALKDELGLPNRLIGSKILENGDLLDDSGKFLGNIIDYFP
ncbi:MAG: hypothetical protein HC872_04755 [Gammaproteobacteria bacterium]|nr:hypothetical protein [Gammaproteobacteria bacterium]